MIVVQERQAIAALVSKERENLAQNIDEISQNALALMMDKVMELIKSTIAYFILFILAIFFAPLGLGYFLGQRVSIKKIMSGFDTDS
jgi:hypothetical protein